MEIMNMQVHVHPHEKFSLEYPTVQMVKPYRLFIIVSSS